MRARIDNHLRNVRPLTEGADDYIFAIANFLYTIKFLTQDERYKTRQGLIFEKTDSKQIETMIRVLNKHHEEEIIPSIGNISEFLLAKNFVYPVLHNLVKNALWHNSRKPAEKNKAGIQFYTVDPIQLIIEPANFPENPSFVPEGARDYSKFVAFRVHDTGEGFASEQEKSYETYFTKCPKKGEHGFGLYFTGLVAKVLRAPVEIKSIPGDTTVSFYHPIYPVTEE